MGRKGGGEERNKVKWGSEGGSEKRRYKIRKEKEKREGDKIKE